MRLTNNFRLVFISTLFLLLVACGGGSSSGSEKPAGNNVKSSITASSSSSQPAAQQVLLSWSHPNSRVNGDYLELDEIGGYEIRYQISDQGDYVYLDLDSLATQLPLNGLPENANFEIAIYDTQGLYSDFVPLGPH